MIKKRQRIPIHDYRSAYFIGIGGVGMSAVAHALNHLGLKTCGSDKQASKYTKSLESRGVRVSLEPEFSWIREADMVIYSSAIPSGHPEMDMAVTMGKPVYHRAEVLSSLMALAGTSVAVTGTHGKTTTSSIVGALLTEMGASPTCLVGGELIGFGTNALVGNSGLLISEVDESDHSHELYTPNYSIITNLEQDHVDHYGSIDELRDSFRLYLSQHHDPGLVIYPKGDPVLEPLVVACGKPRISFGYEPGSDFFADLIELSAFSSSFDLFEYGFFAGRIQVGLPGRHNILNALAALTLISQLGFDTNEAANLLAEFRGARRRLELKFQSEDMLVVDDYAHHPTEVRVSIQALRKIKRPLTVVFQPHRYSRTQHFYREFAEALAEADEVILTEVFSAGEVHSEMWNSEIILEELRKSGHTRNYYVHREQLMNHLFEKKDLSGTIAFIGAGNIGDTADEFSDRLRHFAAT